MESKVAPFTGAWIEITLYEQLGIDENESHPSRVRGLKSKDVQRQVVDDESRTLHGCVD